MLSCIIGISNIYKCLLDICKQCLPLITDAVLSSIMPNNLNVLQINLVTQFCYAVCGLWIIEHMMFFFVFYYHIRK